jgi:YD repeat-containing protein
MRRTLLLGSAFAFVCLSAVDAEAAERCSIVVWSSPLSPPGCQCGVGGCVPYWGDFIKIGCETGGISSCTNNTELNRFFGEVSGNFCAPFGGIYNGCEEAPTEDQCRNPENNKQNSIGDPVDVTTGALEQAATDLDLGRGLVFRRFYASNDPADVVGRMGKGWKHSLDWSLIYTVANASNPLAEGVLVKRPFAAPVTLMRTTFPPPASQGAWTGGENGAGDLAGDPASQLIYTDGDGTRVTFSRIGTGTPPTFALAEIQHPREPAISVTHSGSSTVFSSGGSSLTVTESAGRVSSVTGGGQTWSYSHDGSGCLKTAAGPNPGSPSGPVVWTYTYPVNPTTQNCTNGQLTKVERSINGGPTETVAEWSYTGARVVSVDEQAVDQKLYLTYPTTSPNLSCVVRDAPGTTSTALATFTSNGGKVLSVTGEGGPGVDVPFSAASYYTASDGSLLNRWRTTTDLNGFKTLHEGADPQGRPESVTEGWEDLDSDGVLDVGEPYARRVEYEYHPSLADRTVVREVSSITGAMDLVTTNDYDDPAAPGDTPSPNEAPTSLLRRVLVDGFTLGTDGQPQAFSDQTIFSYDAARRLSAIAGPRPEQYAEIDYDPTSGVRSALRRYLDGSGSAFLEWTFSNFDSRGKPQTITDPNGRSTSFSYDVQGRVLSATPPFEGAGSTLTTFQYDVDGNLTRVDFPVDSAGNPVYLRAGYDLKGNLLFLADSQANAVVYEYVKGRAEREARYTGFVDLANRGTLVGDATFSQDAAGRLLRAFNPLFTDDSVFSEFDWDPKGNKTGTTDENGREDVLIYDALDRLQEIQRVRSATYATSFTYDPRSNATSIVDAANKTTDFLYDDRGHLVRVIAPGDETTLYLHDAAGNLETKIEDFGGSGRTTSYVYDGLDRLTLIDLPNDPDWIFAYDVDAAKNQKGRLASVSNGVVATQFEYTQRGAVALEKTIVDGLAYAVSYAYDPTGNLVSTTTPDGTAAVNQYAGLRPSAVSVGIGTVVHRVDNIEWYPFGPRTHAEFPPFDTVAAANVVMSDREINLRGQIERVHVHGPGSASFLDQQYGYDYRNGSPGPDEPGPSLDRVDDALDPSQSRYFFYDELDRLESETDLAGNVLREYGYDGVGNRMAQLGGAPEVAYSYESGTDKLDFASDPVTQAIVRDFAHDSYGNRIYDGVAPYAGTPSLLYDDANHLVEARDPSNGFATLATYTYDAFGRRVRKVTPTQTTIFVYDTREHLVQEVEKIPTGLDRARTYVFLGDEILGMVDSVKEVGTASLVSSISLRIPDSGGPVWVLLVVVLGSGTLLIVARRKPATAAAMASAALAVFMCAGAGRPPPAFRWLHADPLGAPLAVTNIPAMPTSTAVVWRARYEAFGRATVDQDPDGDLATVTLRLRSGGQYEDSETGWQYGVASPYDPLTGRFLGAVTANAWRGENAYALSRNNPLPGRPERAASGRLLELPIAAFSRSMSQGALGEGALKSTIGELVDKALNEALDKLIDVAGEWAKAWKYRACQIVFDKCEDEAICIEDFQQQQQAVAKCEEDFFRCLAKKGLSDLIPKGGEALPDPPDLPRKPRL